jgi:tetratricopeptide (TPR) repeat protein
VAGDPDTAQLYYAEALRSGEDHGDDALAAEALRHQGGHARRLGDHEQARRLWERSTRLRQRAGLVPGVLSQQLALATNAADTGDTDRAATIATEVCRWAEALGLTRLATHTGRFVPAAE